MARKPTFVMEKRGGRLQFCPGQEALYKTYVQGLPENAILEVSFSDRRPPKTTQQLGYYYGVLLPLATDELRAAGHDRLFDVSVGNLSTGVETSPDTVDLLFKTLYSANRQLDAVPLKRNMDDRQMGELIDFAIRWLAENLHVEVPPPG